MESCHLRLAHCLTSEDFYINVKERLKNIHTTGQAITLIALDFDNFNYINDLFGYEVGDRTIAKINEHFNSQLQGTEVFCRVHSDHFLFCIETDDNAAASKKFLQLANLKGSLKTVLPGDYSLIASGGMLLVKNNDVPLSALVDKANYARKRSKGNTSHTFNFYDEKMSNDVQWQKQITLMMEDALRSGEFEMYLQPKLLIKTGEIVGAEALVRWRSKELGMIYPDKFIPIMERNGFIRQIDFFMLEEACRFLKKEKENGIPQLPISINFSKAHLHTEKLVEKIFHTVNRMGISTGLIEIEFTESLFSDNIDQLIDIVSDLKLLGFRVSMDDFGSEYSSLNYLKDIPIDIVKIDKRFLDSSANTDKGRIIIAKVVELIKSLRMLSVMEGVETCDQVDFLQKLSCDLGQGYFYARPMPAVDYICYLQEGSVIENIQAHIDTMSSGKEPDKSYLYAIPQEFQMDNWELYTLGKNIDMGLMKGYLDGEATVQYVNDRALEYLGYTRQEFREIFQNSIVAFTHPNDVHIVRENAEQLVKSGTPLEFQTRAVRKDGKVIILKGRASCIIDSQGRPVGMYAFQDVTDDLEQKELLNSSLENKIKELEARVASEQRAREDLRVSEERHRLVVEQSEGILFEWDFTSDTIYFSPKYEEIFGWFPITNDVSKNEAIRSVIHPDDLEVFEQWVKNTYKKPGRSESSYRTKDVYNNYLWIQCYSTAICDDSGVPIKAVGIFNNINTQKQQLDALLLKSQLDPLTKLLNSVNHNFGAFFIIDVDNFKGLNDNLGHQLGDNVLMDIAHNVRRTFPETELIGRIGGDEIAVYLPCRDVNAVRKKAEELAKILRLSYYGSVGKYEISGSIGIAYYPEHGRNFADLYRFADIALYESKNQGKDRYTVYSSAINTSLLDNRTPVEYKANFLNSYFQHDITFHVFEMLYETKDVSASVNMILEFLGRRYNMDRVYIFEFDGKGELVNNTYEWCAPDIETEIDNLQGIPKEVLEAYLSQYSEEGVFCCEDIAKADRELYEICEPQGIKSLLHCALYDDGDMIGFIGFDMCHKYHSWTGEEIAVLGYISRILSVFMAKSDTSDKLRTSYKNYAEMLENLNGYVYVIDPKTYEVLYINKATQSLGVDASKSCYEMAFGANKPCANCPTHRLSEDVHYANEEIYSEALGYWVNSAASKMKWEDDRDAVLVCCTDISKYKK